jgi:hypothetical protein
MPGDAFLMRGCSVAICVADLPLCGTSCAFAEAVFYVENQASSVKISILLGEIPFSIGKRIHLFSNTPNNISLHGY